MATHVIRMPDLGEGIAEVELVAWHVKVGDEVTEDQVLADVMTDKATVEIPSSVSGRVASLGGEVGQVLAVGADLIHIETAGDTAPKAASAAPTALGAYLGAHPRTCRTAALPDARAGCSIEPATRKHMQIARSPRPPFGRGPGNWASTCAR